MSLCKTSFNLLHKKSYGNIIKLIYCAENDLVYKIETYRKLPLSSHEELLHIEFMSLNRMERYIDLDPFEELDHYVKADRLLDSQRRDQDGRHD